MSIEASVFLGAAFAVAVIWATVATISAREMRRNWRQAQADADLWFTLENVHLGEMTTLVDNAGHAQRAWLRFANDLSEKEPELAEDFMMAYEEMKKGLKEFTLTRSGDTDAIIKAKKAYEKTGQFPFEKWAEHDKKLGRMTM